MKHVMSPLDFSVEELDRLFDLAVDIKQHPAEYAHACDGKVLATCFYEPSTRTRLSFESAMIHLGGQVLGFSDAANSSASKGESVSDTIRIISLKGRLDNITIGLCGDLKFGRTVHSLINALVRYPDVRFVFISPEELRVPDYITDMLKERGIPYEEVIRLENVLPTLDLLYMTRVQKERFFNEEDYIRLKDFYVLDAARMALAGPEMLVLHPLPRVNEISVEVDEDPRAVYFKQAQLGMYVRMALILTLLDIAPKTV